MFKPTSTTEFTVGCVFANSLLSLEAKRGVEFKQGPVTRELFVAVGELWRFFLLKLFF